MPEPGFEVVRQGHYEHNCDRPGWWRRLKMGLSQGTIIKCRECGQHWKLVWYEGTYWARIDEPVAEPRLELGARRI